MSNSEFMDFQIQVHNIDSVIETKWIAEYWKEDGLRQTRYFIQAPSKERSEMFNCKISDWSCISTQTKCHSRSRDQSTSWWCFMQDVRGPCDGWDTSSLNHWVWCTLLLAGFYPLSIHNGWGTWIGSSWPYKFPQSKRHNSFRNRIIKFPRI